MKTLFVISALFFYNAASAQTHERWNVKTVTDGFSPNLSAVKTIKVSQIETRAKVPIRNTQPRLNFEKQVIKITGTITRKSLESDGDYHIEISDDSMGDSTLVCESVDPNNSVAATSPQLANFLAVRNIVKKKKVGDRVTFTGLVFQDKYHEPSQNRTRNFLEMHPILIAQ